MRCTQYRSDCKERADAIIESMGDVKGKTMIDIGCANGYFMERFLEAGGEYAIGVEPDKQQWTPGLNFMEKFDYLDKRFDFALYLDLYYALRQDHFPYIKWIKEHTDVAYIATSGDGNLNNKSMRKELEEIGYNCEEVIQTGYANRMTYKCS